MSRSLYVLFFGAQLMMSFRVCFDSLLADIWLLVRRLSSVLSL